MQQAYALAPRMHCYAAALCPVSVRHLRLCLYEQSLEPKAHSDAQSRLWQHVPHTDTMQVPFGHFHTLALILPNKYGPVTKLFLGPDALILITGELTGKNIYKSACIAAYLPVLCLRWQTVMPLGYMLLYRMSL